MGDEEPRLSAQGLGVVLNALPGPWGCLGPGVREGGERREKGGGRKGTTVLRWPVLKGNHVTQEPCYKVSPQTPSCWGGVHWVDEYRCVP
jgi:hypothetical protein